MFQFELSPAADRRPVVDRHKGIENLAVFDVPAGADIDVHFGSRDPIPLRDGMSIELCPPENEGLFVSHADQPGVVIRFMVAFGGRVGVGSAGV